MKDPLGVSPSKGNQGTTQGKEKFLLTSVRIEPTTSDHRGQKKYFQHLVSGQLQKTRDLDEL